MGCTRINLLATTPPILDSWMRALIPCYTEFAIESGAILFSITKVLNTEFSWMHQCRLKPYLFLFWIKKLQFLIFKLLLEREREGSFVTWIWGYLGTKSCRFLFLQFLYCFMIASILHYHGINSITASYRVLANLAAAAVLK